MKGRDLGSGKVSFNLVHNPHPRYRHSANVEVKKRFVPGKSWVFTSQSPCNLTYYNPLDLLSMFFCCVGLSSDVFTVNVTLFLHHLIILMIVFFPHHIVFIACRQSTLIIIPPAYKKRVHLTTKKLSVCVSAEKKKTSYQEAALRAEAGLLTWKAFRASELHTWRRLCITSHQKRHALSESRGSVLISACYFLHVAPVMGGVTAAVQPRKLVGLSFSKITSPQGSCCLQVLHENKRWE